MFDIATRDVMERRKVLKLPSAARVLKAARMLARRNAGAILVLDDERLVGIITEPDIVYRVVARGLDPDATQVREVMTPEPVTIGPDAPFGRALALMHSKGFRHLPVVDAGAVLGIVSARSAMDPDVEEFVSEARRREHFMTHV